MRRGLSHAVVIGIALLLLFGFAGSGLRAGFTHDDLMNAGTSLRHPVTTHLRDIVLFFTAPSTFRPAGSLFYVVLFRVYDFSPLPFRVACYSLLAANLVLAYMLALRLTGSQRVAAVATLLLAYHGEFWVIYVSTGLCYDLLCFFFYAGAFLFYVETRQRGRSWTLLRTIAWCALYVLALNSKEAAVSLPAVLLMWELLSDPPKLNWRSIRHWLTNTARVPLIGAGMTLLFIVGRVLGPRGISTSGGYHTQVSVAQYFQHARKFLSLALYEPEWLTPWAITALAVAMLAACLYLHKRPLTLCLFWVVVGIVPVAFIPQRGLDAVYIAALALAISVSILAVTAAERVVTRWTPAITACGLIACVAAIAAWHVHHGLFDLTPRQNDSIAIATTYNWLRARHFHFAHGSRTLFLRDPFPDSGYSSAFLVALYAQDPTLNVDRPERIAELWTPERTESFDYVFTSVEGGLRQCSNAPFRNVKASDVAALVARGTACQ